MMFVWSWMRRLKRKKYVWWVLTNHGNQSHAGKVVERSWYERNKHIFPASRWELYDPSRDYGAYTIKDSSGGRGLNKN